MRQTILKRQLWRSYGYSWHYKLIFGVNRGFWRIGDNGCGLNQKRALYCSVVLVYKKVSFHRKTLSFGLYKLRWQCRLLAQHFIYIYSTHLMLIDNIQVLLFGIYRCWSQLGVYDAMLFSPQQLDQESTDVLPPKYSIIHYIGVLFRYVGIRPPLRVEQNNYVTTVKEFLIQIHGVARVHMQSTAVVFYNMSLMIIGTGYVICVICQN